MNKLGPIVIIEDDQDDRDIFSQAFVSLNYPNDLIFCNDGQEAIDLLKQKDFRPFIIISDINMPRISGLELKTYIQLDPVISEKCVPFILYTTAVVKTQVQEAYKMSVQGFFRKPNTFDELAMTIKSVIDYWKIGLSPANYY